MIRITPDLLQRAMGASADRAALFAPHLDGACARYGISATPARLAQFLAQLAQESGALRWVRELASGEAYEGRADLGNTQPGDGVRYKGRGLIQTTGRANYRALRTRLRATMGPDAPDFEAEPEALEQPRWAAISAADYWDMRRLNHEADADSEEACRRISRAVNRGNAESSRPANHEAERIAYWRRARAALESAEQAPAPIVDRSIPVHPAPAPEPTLPAAPAQEQTMPLPAFVAAALPAIVSSIPQLGKLFGSGSDVAERNVKAAELAVQIVQQATGATNAQQAAEVIQQQPAMLQAASEAIQARWFELAEAGGGGIDGARKAEAAFRASGDSVWRSPSFIVALGLLPLVYMVLVSVLFGIGPDWPSDVRAAIATAIVSLIVGGLMGYYFGQTTSRNRTQP